jgi:hypothetical protein
MLDLLPYLFIALYLTLTIVLNISLWVTIPQERICLHHGALIFGSLFLCSLPPIICHILWDLAKITNLTKFWIYPKDLWAQDGSWGYWIPIYKLNQIISLQVVRNYHQTASALELLVGQQTQMRASRYQNHLAFDYLLAEEGDICGKFTHSDCCFQIDDNRQAITNIVTNIRKISHIPIQTWDGWKPNNCLDSWFSWDPLLLSELPCALVHTSLTFLCISFLLT